MVCYKSKPDPFSTHVQPSSNNVISCSQSSSDFNPSLDSCTLPNAVLRQQVVLKMTSFGPCLTASLNMTTHSGLGHGSLFLRLHERLGCMENGFELE